jgi:hypothetical protein
MVHGLGGVHSQVHTADLGLVQNSGVEQFDRHRAAQLGQGGLSRGAGAAASPRGRGDAECAEEFLGAVLVPGALPGAGQVKLRRVLRRWRLSRASLTGAVMPWASDVGR